MATPDKVKMGVIGLGNIGMTHLQYLQSMPGVELTAVCDVDGEKAKACADRFRAKGYFVNHTDLIEQAGVDAVIVAVPHYDHTPITIETLHNGIHTLCEKPLAVHVNAAQKMIAAYEEVKQRHPHLVFGIMFQERTLPLYRKLKEILDSGELGRLMRVTWINTAWFRSQAYYDSGGWRATWAGEGGGILTNQCPHNLDMYQWLFGLPARISGHANIGKYHNIEVEDEVTAYFEHDNGMIGHFIVSTAESPGTNRLEVVGENGKIVCERSRIILQRNRVSTLQFLKETKQAFANVESVETEVPVDFGQPSGHAVVTQRFVDAIRTGSSDLVAHASEGLRGLTLANGIMLSSWKGEMVSVPFDADEYEALLQERIRTSRFVKPASADVVVDMKSSFSE
ncbi:Gfo/Idh/MocA family protein [Alicyclobacillus kakegawensis]|uniref:Gfo/Idh/MocA family protein n=1 Tax=Alicyclobacillus kakegawensis TaxID=392012 RepID=UPI00082B7885|nr:Gfo/Idh/MocA family oxidoreductase [Alicyclobacillus kakegawensis]